MHIAGVDSHHIDLNGNITGTRCLTFTPGPGQVVRSSDFLIATGARNVTTITTARRDYYSPLDDCGLGGKPNTPEGDDRAWISEPSSPNIEEHREEPEDRPAKSSGRDQEKEGQFIQEPGREHGDHAERVRASMARETERAQEQAQRNSEWEQRSRERAQRNGERAQRNNERAQQNMYPGTYARQGWSSASQQQFMSQMADFGQRMGEFGRVMGELGRQQGESARNYVETQVAGAEAAGRYQDYNTGGQVWRRYEASGGTIIHSSNSFRSSCTNLGDITHDWRS